MLAIDRLLFSEVLRLWRQGIAIAGLLACGIATFIMATGTMEALERSRDQYYQEYRFADAFVPFVRAPKSILDRVAEIPGVRAVAGRVVKDVLLDVPSMVEPVSCRLVSIDDHPQVAMNGVYLRQGRFPERSDRTEVVVSELFANAHGLKPGDSLPANLGGHLEKLHIVGIGLSPEYIYVVQPGLLLSDDRRYGVLWVPERVLAPAFTMEGAINHISVMFEHAANAKQILHELDRLTKPYGGLGAYTRTEQESHERVADEMHQVRTMAYVSPTIFLLVTLFLLHIVFSRLVHQQRESIATMRAFGYFPNEIGMHYTKLVMIWVGFGICFGLIVGVRASWWMSNLYLMFFRFPTILRQGVTWEWLLAIAGTVVIAVAGTVSAIRSAMQYPPAVAMRPEAPPEPSSMMLQWRSAIRVRSPVVRMSLRRWETNPWVCLLTSIGLAFGLAIVVLSTFMAGAIDYVIEHQFSLSQRQDLTLTFVEASSKRSLFEIRSMEGVIGAEPFRSVPVRLRHQNQEKRLAILGLDPDPQWYRILDENDDPIGFPDGGGVTITRKLAEILGVQLGDTVEIDLLEGQDRTLRLPITRIFPNYSGPAAFMNRIELHRCLEEGERLSGVFVRLDPAYRNRTYAKIKEMPGIMGLLDRRAAMHHFQEIIAQSTFWIRAVNSIFAALIAFGVTYNSALISFHERARDLATMRVMGYSHAEVAAILLGEMMLVTLVAIPIGVPISYFLCYFTTLSIDTETHRFPFVVYPGTIAFGIMVLGVSIAISSLAVLRLMKNLDMLSVLKVRE